MTIEKTALKDIYLKRVKEEWLNSKDTFPDFLPVTSQNAKQKNQKLALKQKESFKEVFNGEEIDKELLNKKISEFLNDENFLSKSGIADKETFAKAGDEMKKFLSKVRHFAPDMDIDDIGKAARNYMVYSVFNILNGQQQACTDSIFGYSMLYPVTDNFIDDPNNTPQEKKQYNLFIKDKLMGKAPQPKNKWEKATSDLLDCVEKDYPRSTDSDIYTILLCMLEAQEQSLIQQGKAKLSLKEILDISAYKGGMSVLADRMFVKKKLAQDEISFYLGVGLVLQLGDDLQDIAQDTKENSQTVMTQKSADPLELEKAVNQLLHFTKNTINSYQVKDKQMLEALEKTCCQLILFSAVESREYFSKEYMANIEGCLPVTIDFLNEQKENSLMGVSSREKEKYLKLMDEML